MLYVDVGIMAYQDVLKDSYGNYLGEYLNICMACTLYARYDTRYSPEANGYRALYSREVLNKFIYISVKTFICSMFVCKHQVNTFSLVHALSVTSTCIYPLFFILFTCRNSTFSTVITVDIVHNRLFSIVHHLSLEHPD